jgi:AraC-like DNA-binding protein
MPSPGFISPDDYENTPRSVVVVANDYPHNHVIAPHRHRRAQLLYPSTGVMTVGTQHGTWVVPPLRAVWIPAHTNHEVLIMGGVSMRSVNVDPRATGNLPQQCCVVGVSPLLRELILRAAELPRLYDERGADARVIQLILDEIRALPVLPLHLPTPAHRRLAPICEAIRAEPGAEHSLEDWARQSAASTRTLARLFRRHTGMTFSAWRQQARLFAALTRLASGQAVTQVALELGYASPSAFGVMFRRAFGTTPGRYFRKGD